MDWRRREAEAAAALRECRAELAGRGRTIIDEAVADGVADGEAAAGIAEWRHYPDGEIYDPASHAQFFYHRHPAQDRAAAAPADGRVEHGHFHLFLRGEGIPPGVTPLLLPETAVANAPSLQHSMPAKRGARDEVCHLVAISVDAAGEPIRLFTTNRWVTGETWYAAEDVVGLLDRFRVAAPPPRRTLGRYLTALVSLYQVEIAQLLQDRDEAVLKWRWRRRRSNALDDPRLEIISARDIDVAGRLAAATAGLAEAAVPAALAANRSRLPRMSEGWGD